MKIHFAGFLIIAVLIAGAASDTLLGELPPKVLADLVGILTKGVLFVVGDCVQQRNVSATRFQLYTRSNPQEGSVLTEDNLNELQPGKSIIVITHGWLSNGTDVSPIATKNAYLNETDANVIVTDWSEFSETSDYTKAYCKTPKVGDTLGDLLCKISSNENLEWDTLHLVGHSLGAHVSGFAGARVQEVCNKTVNRITALDPAGPGFQNRPTSTRLDPSDASFVDVIHTNQGFAGYYGGIGTVDFYANCGTLQPHCVEIDLGNPLEILEVPVNTVTCSHTRSWSYFIESISSDQFIATNCPLCPVVCVRDLIKPHKIVMGENVPRNTTDKKYVIKTNGQPPYAKGEQGFNLEY